MAEATRSSAFGPQLSLAAGLRPALATPMAARRLPLAALTAAVIAHAALIFALARTADDGLAGGGGRQLDAISVTLVDTAVLEAREPSITQPPAPAAVAPIETDEGSAQSNPAPQHEKKQNEEKEAVPEPAQAEASIALPAQKPKQDREEESAPAPPGGATVRGDAPTPVPPRATPAAASPGAIREYARYVSQALAKSKPRGTGALGTVTIKLVISPSGGLASAEIVRSSGNRRLDDIALASVHKAALRAPPSGMTLTELTYEVPYHFR